MRIKTWLGVVLVGAVVLASGRPATALDGQALYRRECARCHGTTGRGDGPDADMFVPPPRDLRAGFLARYSVDDLVRRIRGGAPLALALDPPALKARAADVEALVGYLGRLPAFDWRQVEHGAAVWVDRCELCHGAAGASPLVTPPGDRAPRDLSDPAWQRATTDRVLIEIVRHGRRGMPPLDPPVSEHDAGPLVAFVRILSPGFTLYDRYCAACHGDDGRGSGSFGEDARRPTVVFDRDYFVRRDPEQIRSAVWHMLAAARPQMPHFRKRLIDAEARAIVAYLRASE